MSTGNCEHCGAAGAGYSCDDVSLCAACGKELEQEHMRRVASGSSCILDILCATKREAQIIAAATLWASQGRQGAHERTWAITEEAGGWRVAFALAEGADVEKYDYDDVDSLIQYIYEE